MNVSGRWHLLVTHLEHEWFSSVFSFWLRPNTMVTSAFTLHDCLGFARVILMLLFWILAAELIERVVLLGAPISIKDENWEAARKVIGFIPLLIAPPNSFSGLICLYHILSLEEVPYHLTLFCRWWLEDLWMRTPKLIGRLELLSVPGKRHGQCISDIWSANCRNLQLMYSRLPYGLLIRLWSIYLSVWWSYLSS